jgi:hypothetical protein
MNVIFDGGKRAFNAADSFIRADNPINVGQPAWATDMGGNMPTIVTNRLELGNLAGSIDICGDWHPCPTSLSNAFAQLKYLSQALGGFSVSGPFVFGAGTTLATRSYYMAGGGNNGSGNDTYFIIKKRNGTSTTLAQTGNTVRLVNDVSKITATLNAAGTSVAVKFFVNGTLILSATDAVNPLLGGRVGVGVDSGDGVRQQFFTLFSAGSLAASTGAAVVLPDRRTIRR